METGYIYSWKFSHLLYWITLKLYYLMFKILDALFTFSSSGGWKCVIYWKVGSEFLVRLIIHLLSNRSYCKSWFSQRGMCSRDALNILGRLRFPMFSFCPRRLSRTLAASFSFSRQFSFFKTFILSYAKLIKLCHEVSCYNFFCGGSSTVCFGEILEFTHRANTGKLACKLSERVHNCLPIQISCY